MASYCRFARLFNWAIGTIYVKKSHKDVEPFTLSAWQLILALVVMSVPAVTFESSNIFGASWKAWAGVAFSGLFRFGHRVLSVVSRHPRDAGIDRIAQLAIGAGDRSRIVDIRTWRGSDHKRRHRLCADFRRVALRLAAVPGFRAPARVGLNTRQKKLCGSISTSSASFPFGFGRGHKPLAQKARQIERAWRFDEQAKTVATAHDRQRRFRRTEQPHFFRKRGRRCQSPGKAFRRGPIAARDDQARQPTERWVALRLARRDFRGIERIAVAGDQRPHHGMLRLMGLQEADAAALLAAGAAGDLMQQLKRPLRRARIAVRQAKVRIDNTDQS